ncbi:uncharacterized protein LOC124369355 [Homalodisca vitripennis]|uniref:uncharacterized protein LOC124369355 n=1 Tax=Homalodisca vitripennis TaxID=197043 RepID=UPI001EEA9DB8|nr:uncharacterized protein LOC124369355 [Homalodisca vitripennis]
MFDTELFINEVSIRPPLWDLKLKDYSNRDLKSKLWIEVARIVLSNWEQMTNEEKNKEVKELQKKWRSLRDCFAREMKNLKLPSAVAKRRRKSMCTSINCCSSLRTTLTGGQPPMFLMSNPTLETKNAATEENNEDLTEVVASEPATPKPSSAQPSSA